MYFVELIQLLAMVPFTVCKMLSSYLMMIEYVGPTPPFPLILNRTTGVNRKKYQT